MLKFLFGNYKQFTLGKLVKKRKVGMSLSNLGRWPTSDESVLTRESEGGQWNLHDMWFVQGDPECGAGIKVNVVGGPDGIIGLSFTWGDGTIEHSMAEAFVSKFHEAVDWILESE